MKLSVLMKDLETATKNMTFTDTEILGLTPDSRRVRDGWLFVAIPGEKNDGHDFLRNAEAAGARAAVISRDVDGTYAMPLWKVRDSRKALSDLAARYYGEPSLKMRVAGVTGTNGKTSVTYLLEAILKAAGRTPAVLGTIGYRFGGREIPASHTTPESVDLQELFAQMLASGVTDVVMEVSSHAIAMQRARGVHFDVVGFTNLTQDHLDFHGDLKSYFETKKKLFSELLSASAKKNKTAVANLCDARGGEMLAAAAPYRRMGVGAGGDLTASNVVCDENGLSADLAYAGERVSIRSPLIGLHNLENILVAAGMALGLGASLVDVAQGIQTFRNVPGRLERIENKRGLNVFVDYAHTPDGLKRVAGTLKAFARAKGSRLITIFGCGGDRDTSKRPLMAREAAGFSDVVIVTSDNPRTEDPEKIIDGIFTGLSGFPTENLYRIVAREAALEKAVSLAKPGDFLLVAGKGHEDYQIIGTKKFPFSDRELLKRFVS